MRASAVTLDRGRGVPACWNCARMGAPDCCSSAAVSIIWRPAGVAITLTVQPSACARLTSVATWVAGPAPHTTTHRFFVLFDWLTPSNLSSPRTRVSVVADGAASAGQDPAASDERAGEFAPLRAREAPLGE